MNPRGRTTLTFSNYYLLTTTLLEWKTQNFKSNARLTMSTTLC